MSGDRAVVGSTVGLEANLDPAIRDEIPAPLVACDEAQGPNGEWGLLAVAVLDAAVAWVRRAPGLHRCSARP